MLITIIVSPTKRPLALFERDDDAFDLILKEKKKISNQKKLITYLTY